jgi:NCS1 family nucleobase:cation symporter-1
MFAALMWTDAAFYQPAYTGPISNALGGSDLSWLLGIVVGAGVYAMLSVKSVPEEAATTPDPATTTA